MAVTRIDIQTFLSFDFKYPVLDVRSEGEYEHAHIPGAVSLPLFNNEERKVVGTAYKKQSKQVAIKLGLGIFGKKMVEMVEEAEKLLPVSSNESVTRTIVVHCWRGGMRSGGVAWLLDLYGFKVYTIVGGYKAFRQWGLKQMEKEYCLNILGGYTGSGKTYVLQQMKKMNEVVIDLEDLARHKGSAFGNIGMPKQPGQEMFENVLALELYKADERCNKRDERFGLTVEGSELTVDRGELKEQRGELTVDGNELNVESRNSSSQIIPRNQQTTSFSLSTINSQLSTSSQPTVNHQPSTFSPSTSSPSTINHQPSTFTPSTVNSQQSTAIWLEDESQRIGLVNLPAKFFKIMRNKPVYFLDIPFEERLKHIVADYGKGNKEELVNAILRIQKRLGGLETKLAINFLIEDNLTECFRILLKYYDKLYYKGLHSRENAADLIIKLECETVDAVKNAISIIAQKTKK